MAAEMAVSRGRGEVGVKVAYGNRWGRENVKVELAGRRRGRARQQQAEGQQTHLCIHDGSVGAVGQRSVGEIVLTAMAAE